MTDRPSENDPSWQSPQGAPSNGMPSYAAMPPAPPEYSTPLGVNAGLPHGVVPAPWWKRLVARLIDGVISSAIFGALLLVGGDAMMKETAVETGSGTVNSMQATPLYYALSIVLSIIFEIVLVALLGGQIGKLIMGIRIAKAEDATTPPGWGKAILRYLMLNVVGGMTCFIGYIVFALSPLWTGPKKQGYHDMVAKTLVIEKKRA